MHVVEAWAGVSSLTWASWDTRARGWRVGSVRGNILAVVVAVGIVALVGIVGVELLLLLGVPSIGIIASTATATVARVTLSVIHAGLLAKVRANVESSADVCRAVEQVLGFRRAAGKESW
ncbi:hypothetical protein B0O80DRAFT_468742 [Mortierella sp. GBAus27b]|nr:hypothetical protein B0O80DRAFT_468742 [Mortierella sp. GBAus27b]